MKRTNTLLKNYQQHRRMDKGGLFKPFENDKVAKGVGAGTTILDGGLDLLDPKDRFGTRTGAGATGSGALKGAAAGAEFGPAGIAIGAIAGGALGFFQNKKLQEEKQNSLTEESEDATDTAKQMLDARVASSPELQYGKAASQMYAKYGGTVKGVPSNKFSLKLPKPSGLQTPDLLPDVAISPGKFSKRALGGEIDPTKKITTKQDTIYTKKGNMVTTQDMVNLKKNGLDFGTMKDYGLYLDTWASPVPKAVVPQLPTPGSTEPVKAKAAAKYQYDSPNYRIPAMRFAKGGIIPTSSTTAEVKGPSHAKGGVKLDNVELEGGETMADDFVFSKELGFADIHKDVGKAMGRLEKKPATVLNTKTMGALKRKEGFLKIYQEQLKKDKGIPNEIDNTAGKAKLDMETNPNPIMALGGLLPDDPKKKKKADPLEEVTITAPRMLKSNITAPNLITPVDLLNSKITPKLPVINTTPSLPVAKNERASAGLPDDDTSSTLDNVIDKVAPFASNIANAFRKLPAPAKPNQDDLITPALVSLDASRAEAVRQRRGADKTAAAGMNGNNQVAAVKAANLTGSIRAVNEINQAEENTNVGIKNNAIAVNAQITRGNNLKEDYYNTQKVERQLKQQELSSANLSDVGNKVQLMNRDAKLYEMDDTKNLLTMLADPTGATLRASGPTLKRIVKDPKVYDEIVKRGKELEAMNDEDRKLSMAWIKAQLKTSASDLLNTGKALSVDPKNDKLNLANEYLKARTNVQATKKK